MSAQHGHSPRRHPRRRAAAFTMIEVLVTLGIIVVLVTLAIPVTDRVRHRAQASECMSHLRSLGTALQTYLGDHNNVMPTLLNARPDKEAEGDAIDNTLNEYVEGGTDVFRCPSDHKHFYEKTGTSYSWNNLLNGQPAAGLSMMGFIRDDNRIPVMGDKEGFHKYRDVKVNILYADGHVAKEIQFVVDE